MGSLLLIISSGTPAANGQQGSGAPAVLKLAGK